MINNGTLPIHPRAQLVTLSLYIHSQYVPFEQSSMAELVLVNLRLLDLYHFTNILQLDL